MNLTGFKKLILPAIFLLCYGSLYSQDDKLPAFPTAEGGGKWTTGGRGGNVYIVTNTKGSGEGSFSAALGGAGPRTIVFRVSGNIPSSNIPGNTTIAGQTAPGDGVCLNGALTVGSNVIMRYIRVRGPSYDCIGAREQENIILDHVSASFSRDETVSIYHSPNVTIQWCMVAESLNPGGHGFAGIWGGNMNSFHHNLIAHHTSRNPRFCGGARNNDYRNNVLYNWGKNSMYGGEDRQNGNTKGIWEFSAINVVANYYKPGPFTATFPANLQHRIVAPGGGSWYIKDNYIVGNEAVTKDNWDGGVQGGGKRVDEPVPHVPIKNLQTAEEAYELVLKYVGCSLKRDTLDRRVIREVREGTFTHGNKGNIKSIADVGGLPELKSEPAPPDGDNDGMPDAWETAHELNPADAEDRNGLGEGGYTNLENYLNSLVQPVTDVAKTKKTIKNDLNITLGYPNPFNLSPTIEYTLPTASKVKLEVFNVTGRSVVVLVDEVKAPGNYSVDLDNTRLNTGVYMVKFTAANQSLFRKLFLIE